MTPAAKPTTLLRLLLCVLSGALFFLSCADFDIWPLCWFAGVPLLWVSQHPETKRPWVWGLVTGIVANGGGFYWLVLFMGRFGHLPILASVPIFLLMVTYQGITFALFAQITRRITDGAALPVTLIAPIAWVAMELCVPYVFPWYLAITQAWVPPVVQIAELTGPLGVSFLLVLSNGALYELVAARMQNRTLPLRRAVTAASVIVAALVFGMVRIHQVDAMRKAAPKLKIGVVQANIGIHEKWNPALVREQLAVHQNASIELQRRGAELVVWPESSYPFAFARDQATDWPDARKARRGFDTPLLFGAVTMGGATRYPFNSALLLDADGRITGRFDKTILMVFGEYIPFYEQMPWIKKACPECSNFGRGVDVTTFPIHWTRDGQPHDAKLAPMICYEDIFPSFGRRVAKLGPNVLVNITNDAWFGNTSEPWEHMALSVYRAVELRLDLVRAVNTGVSAFIDAAGRVYAKTKPVDPSEHKTQPAPMTLLEDVAILQVATLYSSLGEWFGGACLAVIIVLGLRARSRNGNTLRPVPAALGALALLSVLLVGLLTTGGGERLQVGLRLLAHLQSGTGEALAFTTGVLLMGLAAVGSFVAGAVTRRRGGDRLEIVVAILSVVAVPALLVGTLEGEQAGLVIGALLAIALGLLGSWLLAPARRA